MVLFPVAKRTLIEQKDITNQRRYPDKKHIKAWQKFTFPLICFVILILSTRFGEELKNFQDKIIFTCENKPLVIFSFLNYLYKSYGV